MAISLVAKFSSAAKRNACLSTARRQRLDLAIGRADIFIAGSQLAVDRDGVPHSHVELKKRQFRRQISSECAMIRDEHFEERDHIGVAPLLRSIQRPRKPAQRRKSRGHEIGDRTADFWRCTFLLLQAVISFWPALES